MQKIWVDPGGIYRSRATEMTYSWSQVLGSSNKEIRVYALCTKCGHPPYCNAEGTLEELVDGCTKEVAFDRALEDAVQGRNVILGIQGDN